MLPFDTRHILRYLYVFLLLLILAAAAYVRFRLLGDRSLWLDEAWVANAIIQGDLGELIKKSLTAPLFFTLSIHFVVSLLGKNEFFLRLLPCLFSLGTLVVFYLLIKTHAGKIATLLSLVLLSFSQNFIYYAKELKQYTSAMFFAILVVYFGERVITKDRTRDWILLLLFCILGIGFDHSLIFIVPSVGLALLFSIPLKTHWKKLAIFGVSVSLFLAVFFFVHIRQQIAENIGSVQRYWLSFYPPTHSLASFLKWLFSSTQEMFRFFSLPVFPVSLLLMLIGLNLFYKKTRFRFVVYTIGPFILIIAASTLKRFPYGGTRLMLFMAPLLYLAFGKGIHFVIEKLERSRLYVPLLLIIIFLLIPPLKDFAKATTDPYKLEETRPLLAKAQPEIMPEDRVYVYYGAEEAFKFYSQTRFRGMFQSKNIIWGRPHRHNNPEYASELDQHLRKDTRLWVIFSHCWEEERTYIIDYLEKRGILLKKISDRGTHAYLFKIQ